MSDREDRAQIIIDSLDRDYTNLDGTWTNRLEAIAFIAAALRETEQRVIQAGEQEVATMTDGGLQLGGRLVLEAQRAHVAARRNGEKV